MGADRIRREPCSCLSGPSAPCMAGEGQAQPPESSALWLVFTACSRLSAIQQPGHEGCPFPWTPPSPPWRATLAWVWVFRGRKWQRLLGTRVYLPSYLRDTPKVGEGLHPEGASGINLGQAYHVSEPVTSAVMRCLSILAWPAPSLTGAAAEMTPPLSSLPWLPI